MCNFGAGYWMPGLDFFLSKTMAKIHYNAQQLLMDMAKRISANENGVKCYLAQAGINLAEGQGVSMQDLKTLRELNPEAFNDMIVFLYPELFNNVANGDGKSGSEGGESGSSKVSLSDTDKQGIFNLFGVLITTAGGVLSNIYGKDTTGVEVAAAYAQQEAARTKRTLIIVGIIGVVLLIAGVIVLTRRPGMTVNKI